ncbi:phage major capsid protein [Stakelama marina]|uniref:Phage major capsid protein n=1 Tax=Stakelama marina TaxID=2826939 RepID=A0A8T4IAQ0_9SPHN|nr:phage major capsid protein [Stakelama marina]MBR0551737.1 phage major capsid protein [Stakelama marina]
MNMPLISLPRGLVAVNAAGGRPGATATMDTVLEALEDFKAKYNGRLDSLESFLDAQAKQTAADKLGGGGGIGTLRAADPDYSATFANYFRSGVSEEAVRTAQATGERAQIMASMQSGSESDGGYLAPVEWDRQIGQAQRIRSPLRRLCDVRVTTTGAYSTLWKLTGPGSGWVGETASRPATSTPTFASITFGHGEIYANPAITQRLLDDGAINVQEWLATEVSEEFDKQEGIAFISGDGSNKPYGLLGYAVGGAHEGQHPGGAIQVDASGDAATVTVDGLVDFTYQLPAPYRQNAAWLMNSQTAATIAKMKDADGNFIWRESLAAGQPATLLGRRVEIDENMPNIAADALPILFGDFQAGYVINDRQGVRVLRDPFTNKPFVHFYTTKRVGGGLKDPNAIRALKIAAA